VVNALVLRGFSFPHPEQLMSVGLIDPQASEQNNNFGIGNVPSSQDYEDMRAVQQSFALMAGYLNGSTINVSYRGNPQRYTGAYVTDKFFKIIAVSPVLGRDFTAEDNKPGAEKVAILGHKIWQRDFGSDPKIVGQAIRINGRSATIIGVMPPNFEFPNNEELWVPLYNEFPVKPRGDPNGLGPQVMGRLKPGVSIDQASVEFVGLAKRMAAENPKTNKQLVSANVQPLLNAFTGPQLRQTVIAMLGAVLVVLLIACVNVMNMQFGRAALRGKELAIRGALGATRWRLVRQMLTENFVVAALGAIAGVLMAFWGVDMLARATKALSPPPAL
jgi:predicted permease